MASSLGTGRGSTTILNILHRVEEFNSHQTLKINIDLIVISTKLASSNLFANISIIQVC